MPPPMKPIGAPEKRDAGLPADPLKTDLLSPWRGTEPGRSGQTGGRETGCGSAGDCPGEACRRGAAGCRCSPLQEGRVIRRFG